MPADRDCSALSGNDRTTILGRAVRAICTTRATRYLTPATPKNGAMEPADIRCGGSNSAYFGEVPFGNLAATIGESLWVG